MNAVDKGLNLRVCLGMKARDALARSPREPRVFEAQPATRSPVEEVEIRPYVKLGADTAIRAASPDTFVVISSDARAGAAERADRQQERRRAKSALPSCAKSFPTGRWHPMLRQKPNRANLTLTNWRGQRKNSRDRRGHCGCLATVAIRHGMPSVA